MINIKYYIKFAKISLDRILIFLRELVPHRKNQFKHCGECVFVSTGTIFYDKKNISIKSNVYFGPDCRIFGFGGVELGTGVVLGERVTIMSSNHNYDAFDLEMLPFDQKNIKKPVIIGDYSWIGSSAIVLPGVEIGKYAVIAAGCVLTKNCEDYSIYAGNPGKLVGYRKNQEIDKINKSWPELKKKSIYVIE